MSVNDNWKSSSVQLKPKLEYGIVAVCAPPAKLEETSVIIHYHALSPLGINQNINKEVRLLHRLYQGAQMLDLNHSCVSAKILLLRDYFNSDTTLRKMLNIALDTFIVGTGLDDDMFNTDFKQYGGLATRGRYRHLWKLCTFLNMRIQGEFTRRFCPGRKGDVPFMKELIARNKDAKCLGARDLEIVGRYQKLKKIYFHQR